MKRTDFSQILDNGSVGTYRVSRKPMQTRLTERVEQETGHKMRVDEELGDDLGWFFVETPFEFQGGEFDAEVDFLPCPNRMCRCLMRRSLVTRVTRHGSDSGRGDRLS